MLGGQQHDPRPQRRRGHRLGPHHRGQPVLVALSAPTAPPPTFLIVPTRTVQLLITRNTGPEFECDVDKLHDPESEPLHMINTQPSAS